ncbi:unnamed protein product [Symbiodinium necroappetens]|uniref:Uncharacterized protein n=1 Tax=Symbiodinium necroappetens TaxID=1628268 RepID=A0A813AE30_9DINO|nr:unnamed protein product [Symbiodinium necroappetens]
MTLSCVLHFMVSVNEVSFMGSARTAQLFESGRPYWHYAETINGIAARKPILKRIEEPKTRMRMARHQAARVEQMDLVQLVALSFADLEPHEKLWPGGATHLLSLTENSELVRRRGRWASHRVMEIYIQEVTACTFFPSLPLATRQRVLLLAQAFTATLGQAAQWKRQQVPPTSWYALFSAG